MPPCPNPKYRAPKSHFARRPPLTPAPAYVAPLQWTPPSSPAPPSTPLPSLPPYSLPEPEPPVLRWSPSEGPSSRPSLLPTFRANHPPPSPLPSFLMGRRRSRIRLRNIPCSRPPPRRFSLRRETLLLVVLLVLQLAVLVILGTALTRNDWKRCGGGLEQPTPSTGLEDVVSQASSGNSQLITPEP